MNAQTTEGSDGAPVGEGMYRKLDVLGRIVIPAEIRKSLKLQEGGVLNIALQGRTIMLTPAADICAICGREDGPMLLPTVRGNGKKICTNCAAEAGIAVGLK